MIRLAARIFGGIWLAAVAALFIYDSMTRPAGGAPWQGIDFALALPQMSSFLLHGALSLPGFLALAWGSTKPK